MKEIIDCKYIVDVWSVKQKRISQKEFDDTIEMLDYIENLSRDYPTDISNVDITKICEGYEKFEQTARIHFNEDYGEWGR